MRIAASDADLHPWIWIRIIKVGSGSIWRDTDTNPDPGHEYTVNGQKHGKNLKLILKFGFFATFLKFSLNIYNFFSFVPIY